MESGFWGTEEETYYVNSRGEVWCVQSHVLLAREGRPYLADGLPDGAEKIPDEWCYDFELPEEIY